MTGVRIALILAVVLVAVAAGGAQASVSSGDVEALAEGNNAFALDLYGELRSEEGNIFFSPYSISSALAMTYAGARGGTAEEMAQVLHFSECGETHRTFGELNRMLEAVQQEGVRFHLANSLWPQEGRPLLPRYTALLRDAYGISLTPLDFAGSPEAARQTINSWVADRTEKKIKNLIPRGGVGEMTRLVLANAIYFKGAWADPFEKQRTEDRPFTLADGDQVRTPMMHRTDRYGYREVEGARLLELPYAGGGLSMVVLLPDSPGGLAGLEERLDAQRLGSWLEGLASRKVQVAFPRFEITWGTAPLKEPLRRLGMERAFGPGSANFLGMTDRGDFFISDVFHKAFVEVNEEGTEAAAATAVGMLATALPPKEIPVFTADHPFLFLIRHRESGSILFMGRVSDPTA